MVAQNWIKALNTRLSETPNIGAKFGYGALIVSVGVLAAAGYLIASPLKGAVFLMTCTLKNLLNAKVDDLTAYQHKESEDEHRLPVYYDDNVEGIYSPKHDERLTGYR